MLKLNFGHITVQPVFEKLCNGKNITASALRLDLIHPAISGNKWFKLKYYIEEAKQQKKNIVTFGGAWSNHIVAAACACRLNNLGSTGIIRGEKPSELSDTLKTASGYGMKLFFTERKDYRDKQVPDEINTDDSLLIPEGGYGKHGAAGFADALNYCDKKVYTHFICAMGTGTMLAGIIKAMSPSQNAIGIPVLKNNPALRPAVEQLLTDEEKTKSFQLFEEYHFGGYAKKTIELISFMNSLFKESGVSTDFVYTAKLFYAVTDLINKNFFPAGSNVLIIHSGGLQGNLSLSSGTLIF